MKQIIVLEPHEVARLGKGHTLMLSGPQGEIGVCFERSPNAEKAAFTCPRKRCAKSFGSEKALAMHTRRAHGALKGATR